MILSAKLLSSWKSHSLSTSRVMVVNIDELSFFLLFQPSDEEHPYSYSWKSHDRLDNRMLSNTCSGRSSPIQHSLSSLFFQIELTNK